MFAEMYDVAMYSTPQGFIGVGLVVIYFFVILWAACYRIRKGEHLDHH